MKNHYYEVYILLCDNQSYYTGISNNADKRYAQHKTGSEEGTHYTDEFRPVKLVYTEFFQYAMDAIKREKQIKNWSRAKKEALIAGDIKKLKELSRCKNHTRHQYFEYDKGMVATRPKIDDKTSSSHSVKPRGAEGTRGEIGAELTCD